MKHGVYRCNRLDRFCYLVALLHRCKSHAFDGRSILTVYDHVAYHLEQATEYITYNYVKQHSSCSSK